MTLELNGLSVDCIIGELPEDGWQQWQYKVVTQFQFIGSGLLMCDSNARRLLYDGTNLIIDR